MCIYNIYVYIDYIFDPAELKSLITRIFGEHCGLKGGLHFVGGKTKQETNVVNVAPVVFYGGFRGRFLVSNIS